jgi:serine/threonine protein kinase
VEIVELQSKLQKCSHFEVIPLAGTHVAMSLAPIKESQLDMRTGANSFSNKDSSEHFTSTDFQDNPRYPKQGTKFDATSTLLRLGRLIPQVFSTVQYVTAHPSLQGSVGTGNFETPLHSAVDFVESCISHGSTLSEFATARTSSSTLSRYSTPPVHLTRGGDVTSLAAVRTATFSSEYQDLLKNRNLLPSVSEELNWSGRPPREGQHVEFSMKDKVDLEEICLLGSGSYGNVHKVRCRRIFLARKSMTCSNHRLRLDDAITEVEHLKRMRHAHIIQLVGSYVQGREFSILMYPVADYSLAVFMQLGIKILAQGLDCMKYQEYKIVVSLARFFRCISSALRYIHAETTKHLDIKPANIVVKCHPRYIFGFNVYVTDFGISRHFPLLENSQTDSTITKTPKYCAPEVAEEDSRGRSADIFSLGCVFLEIQTVLCYRMMGDLEDHLSCRPFHRSLPKVLSWVDELAQQDSFVAPECQAHIGQQKSMRNRALVSVIKRMLSSNPKERPHARNLEAFFGSNGCCFSPRETFQCDDELEGKEHRLSPAGRDSSTETHITHSLDRPDTVAEVVITASSNGHFSFLQNLFRQGLASCISSDTLSTALHLARLEGSDDLVSLFQEQGAEYLPTIISEETALQVAIEQSNAELVRRLLSAGQPIKWTEAGLVHAISMAGSLEKDDVLSALLWAGVNVNTGDAIGWTALHYAVSDGNDGVARLLLYRGACIEARAKDGSTPLHVAAESGFVNTVGLLIEREADKVALTNDGETPHCLAMRLGKDYVASMLDKGR